MMQSHCAQMGAFAKEWLGVCFVTPRLARLEAALSVCAPKRGLCRLLVIPLHHGLRVNPCLRRSLSKLMGGGLKTRA
jgi:hypothetical protein